MSHTDHLTDGELDALLLHTEGLAEYDVRGLSVREVRALVLEIQERRRVLGGASLVSDIVTGSGPDHGIGRTA